jgi:hypothetical protein
MADADKAGRAERVSCIDRVLCNALDRMDLLSVRDEAEETILLLCDIITFGTGSFAPPEKVEKSLLILGVSQIQ